MMFGLSYAGLSLALTLSLGRDIGQRNYRTVAHIPRIHVAVFVIPAISVGITAIIEAIASTSAALLAAKMACDYCEIRRLKSELKELEEELEQAEAEIEAVSKEAESDDSSSDEDAYEQDEPKTVEDILEDTTPGRETNGRSTQYEKEGGDAQAEEDFESLGLTNVRVSGYAKIGELPDGRTVVLRTKSEDGRTTLEIQEINKKNKTKIRYNP